jgi:hypothetical protein
MRGLGKPLLIDGIVRVTDRPNEARQAAVAMILVQDRAAEITRWTASSPLPSPRPHRSRDTLNSERDRTSATQGGQRTFA